MARVAFPSYDVQTVSGVGGGVGTFITHLARRFREEGDEVAIIFATGATQPIAVDRRWRQTYESWGIEVIEAVSYDDGLATCASDASIDCILLNWTQTGSDGGTHTQAIELLRTVRSRNPKVPIFLMASRKIVGTIGVEVATLADEFIWILEDTASFIGGRVQASIDRYLETLLPPYAAALARYDREREYSWAAPGHQGGVAFLKSPVGRVFFDFYGENLFRTDMGIERGALGSLLGHSGPVGESERYAARVFGAHRSYTVLNGTSAGGAPGTALAVQ